MADRALLVQADRSKPWNTTWGDLIEAAHAADQLPEEKWKQYARQAYSFTLTVRPIVRRGDAIPISISHDAPRCGSRTPFWLEEKPKLDSKDYARDRFDFGVSSTEMGGNGGLGSEVPVDAARQTLVADGEHRLKITLGTRISEPPMMNGPLIVEVPVALEASFKLVPREQETVTAIDAPPLAVQIESLVKPRQFRWNTSYKNPYLEGMIDIEASPVDLAFEVICRIDGQEHSIGRVTVLKGSRGSFGVGGEVKGVTASNVDLVLKPNIEAARGTVNQTSFWNGQVVIRNVPVAGGVVPTTASVGK